MRLLADGIWFRAKSLEFHSLNGGSQRLISTKFLGIHPFTNGLGIMFRAFVHTNHKKIKYLVYLMCRFWISHHASIKKGTYAFT